MPARLLNPCQTLDEYVASGGGRGVERARSLGADATIELISASGLRGRGGAGFDTATKWASVRTGSGDRFVVCNGAEGEPSTFKDRLLMRRNPYQVIEGVVIAAETIGAAASYIGLKDTFVLEQEALTRAIGEMADAGMLGDLRVEVTSGPDRYLLGEETGLIGVIEGRGPYPRVVRPFMHGLFASSTTDNPTLVNNVETLANIPWIVTEGPQWLRAQGTERSPGSMLFTVVGDVRREGVFELPLGTPLRDLIDVHAGGVRDGRSIRVVIPGSSNAVILPDSLDLPLDFDEMRYAGTGLGSGGFAVFDDSACMVEVAYEYSRFLHIESCAQCPPCKISSGAIYETFAKIREGSGDDGDLGRLLARAENVTDGQKCALPTGTKLLVLSLVEAFAQDFIDHAGGDCPLRHDLVVPKLVDYDEDAGRFLYDRAYEADRPDWTEAAGTVLRAES